ncbi:MAG: four helix bundle protein [Eubacteriales bacterium]
MAESKLRDLSMDFSIAVLKLCHGIKGHASIVNQLERSATSIGANIHEANYAQSTADFVAKLQIALKECYETEYWLELFAKANMVDKECSRKIYTDCGTVRKILISSINKAKERIN